MTSSQAPTIHASAVLVGAKAVLIRGPSGSGKSRLAWDLLLAAQEGVLPFARLVIDDRALVETHAGRLLVRPVPALAGIIEIHGLGIRQVAFEPVAAVGWVVDLAAEDADRILPATAENTTISGVILPRLAIAAGMQVLPMVLASLKTIPANN
jgi:serine kinase of HPr protein (carbohydrate metabolism regulator)